MEAAAAVRKRCGRDNNIVRVLRRDIDSLSEKNGR